jgi:hypothetical protein
MLSSQNKPCEKCYFFVGGACRHSGSPMWGNSDPRGTCDSFKPDDESAPRHVATGDAPKRADDETNHPSSACCSTGQ